MCFVPGAFFSKMCSLRKPGNIIPRYYEQPTMLTISTYKLEAKNIPDALKHVPDLF